MQSKTQTISELAGREVAITGRLASMDRDEARRLIAAAGGRYAEEPGLETSFLVVGQGGPPLDEHGKPTRKVARARELQAVGHTIEVVQETRLLALLGLERRQGELHRLYTTAQLARILDLPEAEVRLWVRHGLIRPLRIVKRLCFFDFPQVATARALSQLAHAGVTAQRIRRSLEELGGWFPGAERALTQLEALEESGELLVRTEDGQWAETSGQLRLDFDEEVGAEAPLPELPAPEPIPMPAFPRAVPAGEPPSTDAESWFERGVDAEERRLPEEAITAYRRALTLDPSLPEACFNLGNVLYAHRRHEEAAEYYWRATELDPDYVEAWNNLGIVQSELGKSSDAIHAFRRALVIAPDYADVHFNLGETFSAMGDREAARRHWRAYLNMDPTSPWSVKVRERLRRG